MSNGFKVKVSFEGVVKYPEHLNNALSTSSPAQAADFVGNLNRVAAVLKEVKEQLVASMPEYMAADSAYMAREKEATLAHLQYELHKYGPNQNIPLTEQEEQNEAANLVYVNTANLKQDAFMTAVIEKIKDDAFIAQGVLSELPENWISSNNCNMATFAIE